MATNFQQPGEVIDWPNATGNDVSSDDVVVIGQILGVAQTDIANGETGPVMVTGVHRLPKVSGAVIAQGEVLVWDSSAGAFDDKQATPASGDISGNAAYAWESAGSGTTTIAVKLNGPGTSTG